MVAGFAFAFSAFNNPATAQAYIHATPPFLDPTYETPFINVMDGTPPYPSGGGEYNVPGGVQLQLFDAGETVGRWPLIGQTLGKIVLAATAFDVGLKIGRVIDTKWLHLSGNVGTPQPNATVTQDAWCLGPGTTCSALGGNFGAGLGAAYATHHGIHDSNTVTTGGQDLDMVLWAHLTGCTYSGTTILGEDMYYSSVVPAAGHTLPADATACNNAVVTSFQAVDAAGMPAGVTHYSVPSTDPDWGAPGGCQAALQAVYGAANVATGTCNMYVWDRTALVHDLVHSLPQTFTNQKVDQTVTMPTTSCGGALQPNCAPTGSMTSAQLTTAQNAITADGATTQGWVNCELAPADYICPDGSTLPGYNPAPNFTLPEPNPNETYNAYISRLRNLGFVGNVTVLDDPGYDGIPGDAYDPTSAGAQLLPQVVTGVGIGVGLGSIVPLYYPNSGSTVPDFDVSKLPGTERVWDVAPLVNPSTTTDIVVMKVPDAYTPTPASSSPPPGAPPPAGSCSLPNIPSVNFSPLTGIDFGNKFPFGVFGWLTTVVGYFNVSPVTPAVDIDMSGLSTFVPGFAAHYAFDLSYFDSYMGTIRTLMSFALWIGAIWYVGTALLGFRAGGDLTEAADDGFSLND